jgi:hypothetical protein
MRPAPPGRRGRYHKNGIYRSGRSTSWVEVKCPAWREANRNRGELFGEALSPRQQGLLSG